MSRLLAELLIFLIATMAWAYLGIPILAQENVAILAQENAGPGKWEYTWGENLLGFGCLGAGVLLYLGMLYTALFKSKDSNYPKYAFAFGLLIASPLIGMVVGLVGAGLGWLVGSLFVRQRTLTHIARIL